MTESWGVASLADVAVVIGRGIAPKYADDGDFIVINQRCVRNGRLSFEQARRHDSSLKRVQAEKLLHIGDVLVNSTGVGTLGRTASVRRLPGAAVADSHLTVVRPRSSTDPGWLGYALSHAEPVIEAMAEGSTGQTELSRQRLALLELIAPPVHEQRAIAATLGSLDDKIESNWRAVAILERLFHLEYRRLIATENVEHAPLGELVELTKGVSYKSVDLQPSRTSLVTLKSFDRSGGYKADGLKPYTGPYKPKQMIEPGEIVVAQTDLTQGAEVVGRAVRVPADASADVLVASLDIVIVRPRPGLSAEYLLGVLVSSSFREHCRSYTSGTTVLHLAGDAIPTYQTPLVAAKAQDRFAGIVKPLLARVDSLNEESVRLEAMRDALLPQLLSGRIRVPVELTA